MLVSDLALKDMEQSSEELVDRCKRGIRGVFHRQKSDSALSNTDAAALVDGKARCIVHQPSVNADGEYRWRRHPQLLALRPDRADQSPEEQLREAKATATRAMFLTRSNRLDEARTVFAEAAGVHELDLANVPGFWDLPRAGMSTCLLAYEDAGRIRDAAALAARVRIHCRPREVRLINEPRPTRRERASSAGD
jgi:hypothetical protein